MDLTARSKNRWFARARLFLVLQVLAGCADAPDSKEVVRMFQGQRLRVGLPAGSALIEAVRSIQGEWEEQTGGVIECVEHSRDSVEHDAAQTYGSDDLLIYPPWALGEFAARDWLQPLSENLLQGPTFSWADYFPALRDQLAVWKSKPLAVPLGTPILVCYFRRDVLEKHGLSPPRSWPQYLELAEKLQRLAQGQGKGGEALPAAVAEPLGPRWRRAVFLARAAAYAKHPDNYSFFFNLLTMQPLVAEQGFVRALEDLLAARNLGPLDDAEHERIDQWIADQGRNRYGDPKDTLYAGGTPLFNERTGQTSDRYDYILKRHPQLHALLTYDVRDVRRALAQGRAALGLGWENPGEPLLKPSGQAGLMGVAPLPGSEQVYHAAHGQWEAVAADVNHPPFLGFAGSLVSVSRRGSHPEAAFHFLSYLAASESASPQRAAGDQELVPYRNAHAQQAAQWVGRDLSGAEATRYFELVRAAGSAEDVVLDLRIPGSRRYREALDIGLEKALSGQVAPQHALQQVAEQWRALTDELGAEAQRKSYRDSLPIR